MQLQCVCDFLKEFFVLSNATNQPKYNLATYALWDCWSKTNDTHRVIKVKMN